MPPPRVFISYSHDSEVHKERVLAFADRLRSDGVDANLDRYEAAPRNGWTHWMQEQVSDADFVLMICTETYHRRLMKREQPGLGLGGTWEGHLIVTSFFQAGAASTKFVPVLFEHADAEWVPLAFRSVTRYDLASSSGYEELYRQLTDQAFVQKPELGKIRALPVHQAKWRDRPRSVALGLPASPSLFVGRTGDMAEFKRVLGVLPAEDDAIDPIRVSSITGLPGVGKTTFVSALPHDPEIRATYSDGILWMAFGQANPRDLQVTVTSTLSDWALEWDNGDNLAVQTLPQALQHWRDRLRGRRVLLVVDDVWDANLAHRLATIVEEGGSALITCRTPAVAERVVPAPRQRYALHELGHDDALLLLTKLAPDVVDRYRADCEALVDDLGCLPLAIVVAGGMLGSERGRAIGVRTLLAQIRDGEALLKQEAPADMVPLMQETTVSVASLLRRSIQVLDPDDQARFAKLAVFAPKPATIDLSMMAAVWRDDHEKAAGSAALLVDHGILQVTRDGTYQLHALLSKLAHGLLEAM